MNDSVDETAIAAKVVDQMNTQKRGPKRTEGNLEIALFDNDREYGGLDKDDNVYVRRREDVFDQPTVVKNASDMASGRQLSLPINVGNRKLVLPLGLTVVTGGTAVGKSSFVRALSTQVITERALAVEPHDQPEDISDLRFFVSADAALMHLVQMQRLAYAQGRPAFVPILDSLRQAVFETTGAAGERGMVMKFFTALTRISSTLARNGLSIVATVNPLQSDAATVNAFIDRLKSSVPCVIELNGMSRSTHSVSFSGRVSVRPQRDPRPFSVTWETNGVPKAPEATEFFFPLPEDQVVEPMTANQRNAINQRTI